MGLREGRGGEGKGREINYPSFFLDSRVGMQINFLMFV
jgi:hypothetical protein